MAGGIVNIKQEIRTFAGTLGLRKVGFASEASGGTAIVALFPYYVAEEEGNLSLYARGRDYHLVAETKLKQLSAFLARYTETPCEIHVDKGKRNDRQAAYHAGLGFYGRNGMLICEEYGSYFFIGQLITELILEPDQPLTQTCLGCTACIHACAGGALRETGFDISRCASELSQKKGKLEPWEEEIIRNSGLCWGCDICQRVCPHNRNLKTTAMPEFLQARITTLAPENVSGISNREFLRRYREYAFSWRGRAVLERNLKLLGERYAEE